MTKDSSLDINRARLGFRGTCASGALNRMVLALCFWTLSLVSVLPQASDWVVAHQDPWDDTPQGRAMLEYRTFFWLAAGEWNGNPLALWSNGSSLWIVEWRLSKIFTYNLQSGKRDPDKDFGNFAETGNRTARGAWSDGATIWVTDDFLDKVFAYDLVTQERRPALDVETIAATGNKSPTSIWSDGEVMWIADDGDDKIYAYQFGTWEYLPEKDFNSLKAAGNTGIGDIWSDGKTLWVADSGTWTSWGGWSDGRLFAYDLSSRERVPAKDFENQWLHDAGMKSPSGIWSDGKTLWISDRPDHKVFIFNLNTELANRDIEPAESRDSSRDFLGLGASGNARPTHMWSNNKTLWVADNDDSLLYAYDLDTYSRQTDKEIPLLIETESRVLNPAGLWSDGDTLWVLDWHTVRAVAFDLKSQSHHPEKDINSLIDSGNHHPAGMWSDGEILWVLDTEDASLYAYDLETGRHRPDDQWSGLNNDGISSPRGIWSDGVTVWIGDWINDKVIAYRWADRTRLPEKDIDGLVGAGNLSPAGLWSNGETLWISDPADSVIYTYPIEADLEVEATPNLSLSIRPDPADATRWVIEFSGILKSAPTISGPFEPVEGAQSPLSIANETNSQFYIVEAE